MPWAAIVTRREPERPTLNTARPFAEDIRRDPVSIAPHQAPEPIERPPPARVARTWIHAFTNGLPRWQEDRLLGRLWHPQKTSIPRGAQLPFEDPANIYLPPSTAYGSQIEIG